MSALAHDIKTPLTIVRGNAELLSETELTTEQKKNITYVLNGTTQIQSYVKQLIDVTKSWNCSDVTYTTVRLEDFFADIKAVSYTHLDVYKRQTVHKVVVLQQLFLISLTIYLIQPIVKERIKRGAISRQFITLII